MTAATFRQPAAFRQPGLRFQVEAPQRDSDLPRMDVAAFVGLAASGPLGTPVALESAAEFRDLFGGDVPLAWDGERGQAARSYLGASVEAFFANGGVRAWVVRVARDPHTFSFPIPGLVSVERLAEHDASSPAWAEARARSAGSWPAPLAVGSALERLTLPLATAGPPPEETLPSSDGTYRLDVVVPQEDVAVGELLELVFDDDPVLFLEVEHIQRSGAALRLESTTVIRNAGSPPASGRLRSVRRLRFELLVWRGDELLRSLDALAFSPRHPRSWTHLPADAELFHPRRGRPSRLERPELEPLLAEAMSPRFPLAGPEAAAALYLPLGMRSRRRRSDALPPAEAGEGVTALELDGLAEYSTRLLLDTSFEDTHGTSLGAEMEHRYSVLGQELAGFHSLLPIEEVSLLALPDAVHPGWTREPASFPDPLAAPEILEVVASAQRLRVTWAEVPGATAYRLERDLDPDFPAPEALFEGDATEALSELGDDCPRRVCFRVRALRVAERGPWSATVSRLLPEADFETCGAEPPVTRGLEVVLTEEGRWLVWQGPEGVDFEVQESGDPDFILARTVYRGTDRIFEPSPPGDGLWFYRVRAHAAHGPGPWSNGAAWRLVAGSAYVLEPWSSARVEDLGRLHRAALRFCAARGDLMAILALPAPWREAEALGHVAALRASLDAERRVLGYGALYHPWLIRRDDFDRAVPPDGAVCGVVAALEREAGAWRAPANRPLKEVAALDPPLDEASRPRLFAAGLNLVLREPRGFLVLSSETLSPEAEHRPIEVRRLLILLRRLALAAGRRYVFEPHGADLHARAARRFQRLLGSLFVRGALAGRAPVEAYRVVSGAPGTDLDRGRFVVELAVAPARALTFLTVRLLLTAPDQLAFEEA